LNDLKKIFATGSADKSVKIWDYNTYEIMGTFKGHIQSV
jgi:WD40 repeat protein